MNNFNFDTDRTKCRPLKNSDLDAFYQIIANDSMIKKYFRFGDSTRELFEFFDLLHTDNSCSIGIFFKSTSQLIGYIGGFTYTSTEILVEFFMAEPYRRMHLLYESILEYFKVISKSGNKSFRFETEPDNEASITLLSKLGAVHSKNDDFINEEDGRKFLVYLLN